MKPRRPRTLTSSPFQRRLRRKVSQRYLRTVVLDKDRLRRVNNVKRARRGAIRQGQRTRKSSARTRSKSAGEHSGVSKGVNADLTRQAR
jgi:hypothetical protein